MTASRSSLSAASVRPPLLLCSAHPPRGTAAQRRLSSRRPSQADSLAPAELFYDRGNHYEFLSLVQELATPGEMRTAQAFDFEFKNVEKQYESYHGINVKLRCVLLSSR